jgi:multidrug efflux pump subunit AcrA (membrane-fusion protein)
MLHSLCCALSLALVALPQDPPSTAPQCVGVVRPARSAALSAPPGLILRSCVEPGTAVEEGALLAEFEGERFLAENARAESDFELARVELAWREREYRRESEALEILRRNYDALRRSVEAGRATAELLQERELEMHDRETAVLRLQSEIEMARGRLMRAEAELELARMALRSTRLYAPFAGIVSAVLLAVGERSSEQSVLELVDLRRLYLVCDVLPNEVAAMRKLGTARVFASLEGPLPSTAAGEARLLRIEPLLLGESRRARIWLDLGEGRTELWPGQLCRALFAAR